MSSFTLLAPKDSAPCSGKSLVSFPYLLLIPVTSATAAIVIQPGPDDGKDTTVISWQPNRNTSDRWNLNASKNHKSLLQFDLSPLDSYGSVVSAKLWFRSNTLWVNSPGTHTSTLSLHRITSAWNDSTVTYKTAPSFEDAPFATRTVTRTIDPADWEGNNWQLIERGVWYGFDVTAAVQGWKDDPSTNNGFLLAADANSVHYFSFLSSNTTATWPRPFLVIEAEAIPEPASVGLWMILSVAGLFILRRNRRA